AVITTVVIDRITLGISGERMIIALTVGVLAKNYRVLMGVERVSADISLREPGVIICDEPKMLIVKNPLLKEGHGLCILPAPGENRVPTLITVSLTRNLFPLADEGLEKIRRLDSPAAI